MDVDKFSQLYSIFSKNDWHSSMSSSNAFNALAKLLNNLKPDQQTLILELLDRYHWIGFNRLEPGLRNMIEYLNEVSKAYNKIFIGPIIKENDRHTIKSGQGTAYYLKSIMPRYASFKPTFINDFSILKIKKDQLLVMVDDYLGSGRTALTAVNELENRFGIQKENIIVLVFSAQESALQLLLSSNIRCHTILTLKRGISDYYQNADLMAKTEAMTKIERLIPRLKDDFRFGFDQTEALLTFLERTPNNTFPIFWMKHTFKDEEYEPPFPR